MNQTKTARVSDTASDSCVKQKVSTLMPKLNNASAPAWRLSQANPQARVCDVWNNELVHMSRASAPAGPTTLDRRIVSSCLMARPPPGARAKPLAPWALERVTVLAAPPPRSRFCCAS